MLHNIKEQFLLGFLYAKDMVVAIFGNEPTFINVIRSELFDLGD